MKAWGDRAQEMVSHAEYNTFMKLRYLIKYYPNFNDLLLLVNQAVLVWIHLLDESNRDWRIEPQAIDFERVQDMGESLPQITREDIKQFNLYIDNKRVLRSHGRKECILGTIPPDTLSAPRQIKPAPNATATKDVTMKRDKDDNKAEDNNKAEDGGEAKGDGKAKNDGTNS